MVPLLLLPLLLHLCRVGLGHDDFGNATTPTTALGCREAERDALLLFRSRIYDPTSRLPPWSKEVDCCVWEGVRCNMRTGRVAALDLRNPYLYPYFDEYGYYPGSNRSLGGVLTPSLVALERLAYLDLSGNLLFNHSIPSFLGSFRRLRYLNLSYAGFTGRVPPGLGNLSRLTHLDLSNAFGLEVDDLRWISGLSSLQVLNLSGVTFTKAAPSSWIQSLNMLPSIREINLESCSLTSMIFIPPSSSHGAGGHDHVNFTSLTRLDLRGNGFTSAIPSWLLRITSLEQLDLSWNAFSGTIPYGVGNLTSLKHLILSGNYFLGGPIPVSIGTLSNLAYLDLSWNNLSGPIPTSISGISNLAYLHLSQNNLSGPIPTSIGTLSNLTHLYLSYNKLSGSIPVSIGGLSSLVNLYLNSNDLSGSIPVSIGGLSSLVNLYLNSNDLSGTIPVSIGGLSSLTYLDLSWNNLSGSIPVSIGGLSSLKYLYLNSNNLTGTVPVSIGRLSNLSKLDLSENSLGGVLTEAHFASLTNLKSLSISTNPSFSLKVGANWNPPFRLNYIYMRGCKLGPQFPAWLRTQENYITSIDMSHAHISDAVPEWFRNLSTQNIVYLDLSYNNISGPLQFVASNSTILVDLSHNLFSGTITGSIVDHMPSRLVYLKLSTNNLTGTIPDSICTLTQVDYIDLSQNYLTGKIPSCWDSVSSLRVLDLSNNNLFDQIPMSMCSTISSLRFFSVSNNNISGDIPPSLSNCESMAIFDAADNMLSGSVPSQLSTLPSLRILNLSKNNLSGSIPNNFGNFTGMKKFQHYDGLDHFVSENTEINERIYSKGRELMYSHSLLGFVVNLDISDNSLSGNIPSELGNLLGLRGLSLSGNHLTGHIPKEIDKLKLLESFDLSRNKLIGEIPSTLAELTFLSWLNLSYNNLSGMIPYGNQLQTLDNSSYIGNPYLCGFPLTKACQGNKTLGQAQITIEDEEDEILWLYAGLAPGFAVAISIILVVLMLHRSLRIAYFRFIDNTYENIYVLLVLGSKRLKMKFLHQS